MRVAFDVGPLKPEPAGVGTYVRELANAVAAQLGPKQLRFVGAVGHPPGFPPEIPVTHRAGIPYSAWVISAGPSAASVDACDVVHQTDGLVSLLRRRPTVVTVQDLTAVTRWREHRLVRLPRVPFVLAAPRLADAVLAPSRATADEIIRLTRTGARSIHVVPLAPRASIAPPAEPEVIATCRSFGLYRHSFLLVPGTLEPRKNGLRVVAAFERAIDDKRIPVDIQLVFAGGAGWKSRRVLDAVRQSAHSNRIKVLGYVTDAELSALMTGASGVLYLSLAEGFGLPVLEALACGAPVVTSDRSSMPEVGGDVAVYVDPTDTLAIAEMLSEVVGLSSSSRAALWESGRRRAGQFTWSRTATATIQVYEAIA